MNSSHQELTQKVIEMIVDIAEIPSERVTPEKNLVDELEIDSMTMAEMAVALEDRFYVELPHEDMQLLVTVQDVADYLLGRGVTPRDSAG